MSSQAHGHTACLMTNFNIVLWTYIGLLMTGGLIGFLKAGSKASLIASCLCAAPLVLAALDAFGHTASPKVARVLIGILFGMFAYRWWGKRKFMPSGLMALASLAASVLMAGLGED